MSTSYQIVLDPTEAIWRKDWDNLWFHCITRGWVIRVHHPCPWGLGFEYDPMLVLNPELDCIEYMGQKKRQIQIDYRQLLIRLEQLGTWRGWLHAGDGRYAAFA